MPPSVTVTSATVTQASVHTDQSESDNIEVEVVVNGNYCYLQPIKIIAAYTILHVIISKHIEIVNYLE